MNGLRNRVRNLESLAKEKKKQIDELGGVEILKGDEVMLLSLIVSCHFDSRTFCCGFKHLHNF